MVLPIGYNIRSLRARFQVTLMAVLGIALVVAVVAILMSMSEGFATALRETGRPDNAIIVQRGTPGEAMSRIVLEHRQAILNDDRLVRLADGRPLASWETVTTMSLRRRADGRRANVTLRGVTPQAFEVRGGIEITAGRRFSPGLSEVMVGRRILDRVRGLDLGGTFLYRRKEMKVVGVFESQGASFESEVWMDFDLLGAYRFTRTDATSLVVRMRDPTQIGALDRWIRSQPGMALQALPERQFYEQQSGVVSTTLKVLAAFVALVMGVGAVFGAMNTMYAIVAARTREIGTLRAIGFSRGAILLCFVMESGFLALVGGVLGCLLALTVHGYSTGAANMQSYTEVAYAFRVTPRIVASCLSFAVVLGIVGGLLPALRAARLSIAAAVREA
ncbi:MAG: ABC transporter permease [Vicinamibacteria bacterium]|nr:ABC transporter permease [Vicinamibacteria bacterium]